MTLVNNLTLSKSDVKPPIKWIKMWKLLLLALLVVGPNNQVFGSITPQARQNADIMGPVSNIMHDLVVHTTEVTDDLISQLSNRIERTTKTIVGDIEVILAQAMEQLTQPIIEAQNVMEAAECQQQLSMDELRNHIDSQLSVCTTELNDILLTFQNDSHDSREALKHNVAEIAQLPSQCQDADYNFGGTVACFIEKIVDVNRDIAIALNRASMAIMQTLQVANRAEEAAQGCAENAVANSREYLNGILANCQMNVV